MYKRVDLFTPSMRTLEQRHGFDTVHARKELVRLAGDLPGSSVLDVGTGSGWMAIILAESGLNVVTVDVDRGALQRARQRLRKVDPEVAARVRFIHGDGLRLPFAASTFHAVFSFDSMHHLPDCRAVMAEMARVCCPLGVLAVADLNSRGLAAVRAENASRGESHYENPCRVDAISVILERLRMPYRRFDSAFVCSFVARRPGRKELMGADQLEKSKCGHASERWLSRPTSAGWSIHRSAEVNRSLVEQFRSTGFVMVDDREVASEMRRGDMNQATEHQTWIAREADRIVGLLSMAVCNSQIARVTMMCVEPRLHHSRLPIDLLAYALRVCMDAGVLKIVLSTHLPQDEAWKRFGECGYQLARSHQRDGRHQMVFYLSLSVQPDCERPKSIALGEICGRR